jgi:protease-4
MNEPVRSCRHVGFWVSILLLGAGLAVSLLLNFGLIASRAGHRGIQEEMPVDEYPEFKEEWSCGNGDTKVVRIALNGVIMRGVETGWFGNQTDMTETVIRQIRAAGNDEDVRAIILEVDSPGGAVTPSDEIHNAIKVFRAGNPNRRVLVFIRDLCASGGYYVSVAADRIMAEPTSLVGSIGVIMETLNWSALSQKVGVDATTIKSGPNKDLLNPFRPADPEDVRILQTLIDDAYQRFCALVADGRKLSRERLAPLADGRILSAEAACEAGLVDEIGYWDDAVKRIGAMLEVKSVQIVRYTESHSLLDKLMGVRAPATPIRDLTSALPSSRPRMMYLWRP